MDSRDYHQPYSAYPAHPRVRAIRSQPYYDNERELSLDSLSLSDDECTEDMFLWTKSSRNQGSRDSHRRGQKGEYQGTNRTFVVPRSQGPAIDTALRSLRHELSASLKIFQPLVQCFEADIEPLRDWAEELTLDTVWKNKAKKFFREKRDRRRYEGMATRISRSRATVKDAIKDAKVFKETWDKHNLERQILTAKKAIVFCDGIVGLAERAASDRRACKQLVVELEEARSLLDRKKHPWIYGEEEVEQQVGDMEKLNGRMTDAKREQRNGGNGTGKEQGGWFRPAGLFPGYSGVRSGDNWM